MSGRWKSLAARLRTSGLFREWRHGLLIWLPIFGIVLFFLNDLEKSHDRVVDQAYEVCTSYVHLVEEHASSVFDRTNLVLDRALGLVNTDDLTDAKTMREPRREALTDALLGLQRQSAGIVSMTVTDAEGRVFANTVGQPAGGSLGDRRYFLTLREQNSDQPVVSELIFGRFSHKWGLQMARALHWPDGRFAGMIVANVGMSDYFEAFYQSLNMPEGTLMSLRDMTHHIVVRYPIDEAAMNRTVVVDAVAEALDQGRVEGRYRRVSPIDGTDRMVAFRKLPHYPLYAIVGMTSQKALQDWADTRNRVVALSMGIMVAGVILNLLLHRQRRLDLALADNQVQLHKEQARIATEANRAKSQFLAMMSHEIRTPMNGILGMTYLLAGTGMSEQQQDCVETIRQSGETLLTVLNDILDFSKLEAERLSLEEVPFELAPFVESTAALMRGPAEAKGLPLLTVMDPALPPRVVGDPNRIRQILLNFLSNAVKFTEAGGIIIELACNGTEEGEARLLFKVSDTGIGIPHGMQRKLFTAFTQADSSISRRFGGTGLGLAISQRLVQLMGGIIGLRSIPGEGSSFWFTLTLPLAGAVLPKLVEPEVPLLPSLSILLAEDNVVNRKVAEAILLRAGHRVVCVGDGEQAVAAAEGGRFDLVLMDVQMPAMDGLQATRLLRSRGYRLAIVALTANAMSEDWDLCLDAGMDGYVPKPFTPEGLFAELARVLKAREVV